LQGSYKAQGHSLSVKTLTPVKAPIPRRSNVFEEEEKKDVAVGN